MNNNQFDNNKINNNNEMNNNNEIINEIWQNSPDGFIDNGLILSVSNKGRVKFVNSDEFLPIINAFGGKNTDGKYAGITVDDKSYHLHRLVYMTFHPNDYHNKGRVQFKKFHSEMLNEDGMYRCHLDDLIFIKQTSMNQDEIVAKLPDNETQFEHPIYGSFICGKWLPLHIHIYDNVSKKDIVRLYNNYEIILLDDMDTPCLIRNVKTKKYLTMHGSIDKSISVTYNKVSTRPSP